MVRKLLLFQEINQKEQDYQFRITKDSQMNKKKWWIYNESSENVTVDTLSRQTF